MKVRTLNDEEFRKYVKALQNGLMEVPVRKGRVVYITDIIAVTSLPKDMIIEILSRYKPPLPEGVEKILDDEVGNRLVYRYRRKRKE
ncbi:MAG: hypothetical protein DRP30_05370 [Thermotoga sp.]|nr:MAG: hypothetical protein DRP30_05370 [Thermotoga sp.]